MIDLDNGNTEVESYISYSFDNLIKCYTDDHDTTGAEITIDTVVLGGLTINLLDWQEKKVKEYIDRVLVFA
jgi:hypothetical protein